MMIVVLLLLDSVVVATVVGGGTVGVILVALNELTSAVITSPEGRTTRKSPDLTAASSLAIVLIKSSVDWPFWGVIVKVTLMLPDSAKKSRMQLLFVTFQRDCRTFRVNSLIEPLTLLKLTPLNTIVTVNPFAVLSHLSSPPQRSGLKQMPVTLHMIFPVELNGNKYYFPYNNYDITHTLIGQGVLTLPNGI